MSRRWRSRPNPCVIPARCRSSRTGDAIVVAVGGELCPATRGGEEGRTRGLKLCPPRVLAKLGLGKRWRGWRISATPVKQNTKNYENVQLKMRKITHKTNLKLRKLCKTIN